MIMALLSAGAAGGTTKNVMGKDPLKRPSDAVQLVGNQGHVMVPEGKGDSKWVFKDGKIFSIFFHELLCQLSFIFLVIKP